MGDTIYGTDLWLTRDGDLLIFPDGNVGTLDGLDNLDQAITNLLNTPQGWLYENDSYGSVLEKYWGKPNTPQTRMACAKEIQETLSQDPRISKIIKITTRQVGQDRFDIEVVLVPAGQTQAENYVYPLQLST